MKRADIIKLMEQGYSDDEIEAMLETERQRDIVSRKQNKQQKKQMRRKPREDR